MPLNEEGSTHDSNSESRRKYTRFFLCGLCSIVSIAENTSDHEGESRNNALTGNEKRFEDECRTDQGTTSSRLNLSSKDEASSVLQELKQDQSLSQGTVIVERKELKKCVSSRAAKICWKDSEEVSNMDDGSDDVEKDGAECGSVQSPSRMSPTVAEQGSLIFRTTTPCQSEMAGDNYHSREVDEWENNETRGQQMNSTPQVLESFESTGSHTPDKETSGAEPIAEDSVGCSAEASNVPKIKINDTVVKPGSRWKRAVAHKVNAKRNRKMQRDSVTMNEEYELMMKNLKRFGVL